MPMTHSQMQCELLSRQLVLLHLCCINGWHQTVHLISNRSYVRQTLDDLFLLIFLLKKKVTINCKMQLYSFSCNKKRPICCCLRITANFINAHFYFSVCLDFEIELWHAHIWRKKDRRFKQLWVFVSMMNNNDNNNTRNVNMQRKHFWRVFLEAHMHIACNVYAVCPLHNHRYTQCHKQNIRVSSYHLVKCVT